MAAVIESLVNRILECEEIAEKENRRFIAVKDSETYDIVQSERNANTVRATSSHLRLFKNWLQSEQEFRQPESISQQDLDMYLARFFLSIRKTASDSESKSGDRQYEPDTLRCIHSSIHRHLQQNGYKGDIIININQPGQSF